MRFIRNNTPFILLGITFLCSLFELFFYDFYSLIYFYLSDLFGYSILTNIFMCSVYLNKKYCSTTKLATIGLLTMNIFSIVSCAFDFHSIFYNLIIESLILGTIITYLIKGNDTNNASNRS